MKSDDYYMNLFLFCQGKSKVEQYGVEIYVYSVIYTFMDEIPRARAEKFQSTIRGLRPKSKAVLDFLFANGIDTKEARAPHEEFNKFSRYVIALNRRNNGNFSAEEAEEIIEVSLAFGQFFEDSEMSIDFGDILNKSTKSERAFNKAREHTVPEKESMLYSQIIDKLFIVHTDDLRDRLDMDADSNIKAKLEDILFLKPRDAWRHGLFGVYLNLGRQESSKG